MVPNPPSPLKRGSARGGNWLIVNSLGFICPREFFYYVLSFYRAYDGIPLAQSPSPIKRGKSKGAGVIGRMGLRPHPDPLLEEREGRGFDFVEFSISEGGGRLPLAPSQRGMLEKFWKTLAVTLFGYFVTC